MKKTLILLFSLVLFTLAWSQDTGTPGLRIKKTVHHCRQFEDILVHPTGYIVTKATNYGQGPVLYSIAEDRLIPYPPLGTISGVPEVPDAKPGTDYYKQLKREGRLWSWGYNSRFLSYDPDNNRAGILLEKNATLLTLEGNPPCKGCGGESVLIDKYQRYYCYSCKKYVDEKDYLQDSTVYVYAEVSLNPLKVRSIRELPLKDFRFLTITPDGKYLYFSNQLFFYGDVTRVDKISLVRYNTALGKFDWQHSFEVVPRRKSDELFSHSISVEVSPDGKKLVFIEYDEGMLHNPGPQAYFLDVEKKTVAVSSVPPTAYGRVFDREGRWLFLGSNQKGTLHRFNLETGAEELKVQASKTTFHFVLSPRSQYLMVFNKKNLEVRKYPGLELVKTYPLSTLFKGVNQLLVSETMLTTLDGRHSVIGILKTDSQWASSDLEDGFYLLETLE